MSNKQQNTLQNAVSKIDYTLMNDYMFRAVLQENEIVLKGLICSLLRLKPEAVLTVTILNPIELGKGYDDKIFVLDVKVLLNDATVINIEMQVVNEGFWTNRSLSYLCGIFDLSPFPDYPEFFATYKMMNVKKHYIYNNSFTLNVLDLNQIELATDEDKAFGLDYSGRVRKSLRREILNSQKRVQNLQRMQRNSQKKMH